MRRRAEAAASDQAETPRWAEDPVGLADHLDRTAVMARPPARSSDGEGAASEEVELRLPKGVAPDAKESVAWLVGRPESVTVIVDGYNVGYLMAGERAPAPARLRVAPVLAHLHKMARGALKVIVVYDSNLGPAETPATAGPVSVRYSDAGATADDEIVRLAGCIGGPVVVISNDRAVRDRSEAVGALPLWSEALLAWAGTR